MSASDYMPQNYPDMTAKGVSEWTGKSRWYAVYTVQLGELIEKGVFDWTDPILDWSSAAYNDEQYKRVCSYFIERFRFREISIVPFYEWAAMLHRRIVYELMPKYRMLYEHLADFDPAQIGNSYTKGRTIGSTYPETLLSGNSDYISDGQDSEHETVTRGNLLQTYEDFVAGYHSIDESMLDELNSMFIGLYTADMAGM